MENAFLIWFLYVIVPVLGFVATFFLTKTLNNRGEE